MFQEWTDVIRCWRVVWMIFDRKCGKSMILKASCTRNLLHQDRYERKILLQSSEVIEVKTSSTNVQTTDGITLGPGIMTMLWITCHSLCSNLWLLEYSSLPHPPHSPDLTPCNVFLFPKMKLKLKGQRFNSIKRSRPYCRMWWRRWHEMTSRNASDPGNTAGITVSML